MIVLSSRKITFRTGEGLVCIVRNFKKTRPYTGGREEQMWKFEEFLKILSGIYGLEPPKLYVTDPSKTRTRFDEYIDEHLGCYQDIACRIAMRKFSVLTVLHEFRHFLQYRWRKWVDKCLSDDVEKDATIWSETLFQMVFKKMTNERSKRL